MSFPTTLDSFSTKVDAVDYPQASHVNALQTAVSALETKVGIDNSAVATSIDYILKNNIWPVGSIYINAGVSTNPATLLGFGTWTAFGAGKMIIGIDGADADFDSLADTGGAKTSTSLIAHTHTGPSHTHTGPSHTHTGPSHTHAGTSDGESGHTHALTEHWLNQPGYTHALSTTDTNAKTSSGAGTGASTGHTHTFTTGAAGTGVTGADGTGNTSAAGTGATGSAGSGASFSIMNPYVTAYMWKRTA